METSTADQNQFLREVKERAQIVSKSARQNPGAIAEKFGNSEDEDEEMQDYLAVIRGTEVGNSRKDNKQNDMNENDLEFASSLVSERKLDFSKERTKANLAQRRIQKRRRPQSWAWTASSISPDIKIDKRGTTDEEEISISLKLEDEKNIESPKRSCGKNRFSSPTFSGNLLTDLENVLKKSKETPSPKVTGAKPKCTILHEDNGMAQDEPVTNSSQAALHQIPVQPILGSAVESPIISPSSAGFDHENIDDHFKDISKNLTSVDSVRQSPGMQSSISDTYVISSPKECSPLATTKDKTNLIIQTGTTSDSINIYEPTQNVPVHDINETKQHSTNVADTNTTKTLVEGFMFSDDNKKLIPDKVITPSPPKPKPKPKAPSSSALLAKTAALSNQNRVEKEEERKTVNRNPTWLDELIRKKEQSGKSSPFATSRSGHSKDKISSSTDSENNKVLPAWMQREVLKHEQGSSRDGCLDDTGGEEEMSRFNIRKEEVAKEVPSWLKELNRRKLKKETNVEDNKCDETNVTEKNGNKLFDFRSVARSQVEKKPPGDNNEIDRSASISNLRNRFSQNVAAGEQPTETEVQPLNKGLPNIHRVDKPSNEEYVELEQSIKLQEKDGETEILQSTQKMVSAAEDDIDGKMRHKESSQPIDEISQDETRIEECASYFNSSTDLSAKDIAVKDMEEMEASTALPIKKKPIEQESNESNTVFKDLTNSKQKSEAKNQFPVNEQLTLYQHINEEFSPKSMQPSENKKKIANSPSKPLENQNKDSVSYKIENKIRKEDSFTKSDMEPLKVEQKATQQALDAKSEKERYRGKDVLSVSVSKGPNESTSNNVVLPKGTSLPSKPPPVKAKPKLSKLSRDKPGISNAKNLQSQPLLRNVIPPDRDTLLSKTSVCKLENEAQQAQGMPQKRSSLASQGGDLPIHNQTAVRNESSQENLSQEKKIGSSENIPKPLRVKLVRVNSFEQGALKKPNFEMSKENIGNESSARKTENEIQNSASSPERQGSHTFVRNKSCDASAINDLITKDKKDNENTIRNVDDSHTYVSELEKDKKKSLPPRIKPKPKVKPSKEQIRPEGIRKTTIDVKEDEKTTGKLIATGVRSYIDFEIHNEDAEKNDTENQQSSTKPTTGDNITASVSLREKNNNTTNVRRPVSMIEDTVVSRQYPKRDRTSTASMSSRRFSTELEKKQNSCWFRGVIPEKVNNVDDFDDVPAWKKQLLARLKVTEREGKKPDPQRSSGKLRNGNNITNPKIAELVPLDSKNSTQDAGPTSNKAEKLVKEDMDGEAGKLKHNEAMITNKISGHQDFKAKEQTGQRQEEWV